MATLLYGVAALIGAVGSAAAVVINALRSSRRERPVAARQALGRLAKAAADGKISGAELASVLDKLHAEADDFEYGDEYGDDEPGESEQDESEQDERARPGRRRIRGVLPQPDQPSEPKRRRTHRRGTG